MTVPDSEPDPAVPGPAPPRGFAPASSQNVPGLVVRAQAQTPTSLPLRHGDPVTRFLSTGRSADKVMMRVCVGGGGFLKRSTRKAGSAHLPRGSCPHLRLDLLVAPAGPERLGTAGRSAGPQERRSEGGDRRHPARPVPTSGFWRKSICQSCSSLEPVTCKATSPPPPPHVTDGALAALAKDLTHTIPS